LDPWKPVDGHTGTRNVGGFSPGGTHSTRSLMSSPRKRGSIMTLVAMIDSRFRGNDNIGMMKTIPFWKMSGSGNDFVIIDNRRHIIGGGYSGLARRLCHRQFGVGADGLLLLEKDKKENFRMVYYNADGSHADMCGNGARCMAYFAHARGAVGRRFRFRTDAYPVGARVQGSLVRV